MLEANVDKFKFRIPEDLWYSDAGVWIRAEESRARLGLTDFGQQVNGDVAFATVRPAGTELQVGDEFATIETVKVDVGLPSPVRGRIVEVNPGLTEAPEWINQDPYGSGWLAVVELTDWEADKAKVLDAPGYLDLVRTQAEAELKK